MFLSTGWGWALPIHDCKCLLLEGEAQALHALVRLGTLHRPTNQSSRRLNCRCRMK